MTRILAVVLSIVSALGLSACTRDFSWHQKLTVTVVTPAGERSGSAVLAVYVNSGKPFLTPNVGVRYGLKGEATVVEVAPGKYLFALLDDQRTPELAMQTWLPSLPKKQWDDVDAVFQTIQDARETRPVPREFYPLLVTFGNLGNPASVREVKPADLAASFGPGFALKSITLEITDEPVTEGRVESVLPWIFSLHTRLIPTQKKFAKDYLPIENIGPEYFITPYHTRSD